MKKTDILIGSMLWVLPGQSEADIEQDVQGMLDNGLIIARIFLTPGTIEKEKDQWDFSTWDRLFRVSERLGLKLTVTLGTLGHIGWVDRLYQDRPRDEGWYRLTRERVVESIKVTVARYKDSSALHSWILQNEPALHIQPDSCTLPMFRRFLLERYNWDLPALQKAYGATDALNLVSFDPRKGPVSCEEKARVEAAFAPVAETIGVIHPDGSASLSGVTHSSWVYTQRVDWAAFNEYLMMQQLSEGNEAVKALDKVHPTTINPCAISDFSPAAAGCQLYSFGKTVDFLGCSCHVSWHSTRFALSKVHQSVAMFSDMMRSSTADPDGYFWITELQSGTNFFSGNRPMVPRGSDITHWLWEAIATGCKGMVYWLYKARPSGFEGLEWGILDQQNNPSRRTRASKAVADVVYGHRELFGQTRPKPYDGYILHSYDSMVLSFSDRHSDGPRPSDLLLPRNNLMVQDAAEGAYTICQDVGLDVGFVGEHEFTGELPAGSFLLAPNTYGLAPEVIATVRDYVANGGTLIADGLFGAKDPYGFRSEKESQALLGELFGRPVDDWGVSTEPFDFALEGGGSLPGWYLSCSWDEEKDVRVLARDDEGYPSVVEHRLGKGRAVYVGTEFFQSYFAHSGVEGYREFFASLLPEIRRPYTLHNPSAFLRMKLLEGAERDILILLCRQDDGDALVSARRPAAFRDLLSGEAFSIGESTAVPMKKLQVRVLVEEK